MFEMLYEHIERSITENISAIKWDTLVAKDIELSADIQDIFVENMGDSKYKYIDRDSAIDEDLFNDIWNFIAKGELIKALDDSDEDIKIYVVNGSRCALVDTTRGSSFSNIFIADKDFKAFKKAFNANTKSGRKEDGDQRGYYFKFSEDDYKRAAADWRAYFEEYDPERLVDADYLYSRVTSGYSKKDAIKIMKYLGFPNYKPTPKKD